MGGGGELWALILAPDNVVHRARKNNLSWAPTMAKTTGITEQRLEFKEIVLRARRWQEREAFLLLTQ